MVATDANIGGDVGESSLFGGTPHHVPVGWIVAVDGLLAKGELGTLDAGVLLPDVSSCCRASSRFRVRLISKYKLNLLQGSFFTETGKNLPMIVSASANLSLTAERGKARISDGVRVIRCISVAGDGEHPISRLAHPGQRSSSIGIAAKQPSHLWWV